MRRFLIVLLAVLAGWLAAAVPAAAVERGYVLGSNDTITVQVYGQPEAGVTTRIKSDGTIVMPLVGTLKAEGQTQLQLAQTITKKLVSGGFFKAPLVNIEVVTYVSKTVNVAGKVAAPGVFPLDRDYTVLEVLLKSGWLREAGANYVYLRRAGGGPEIKLDTESLVRGAPDKNLLLAPGDTIFVPDADTFYISGAITRPGQFPILPGMTLRQAIVVAGGLSASGSERKIALIRGGAKEAKADLDKPVLRGDQYVVKERLF